MATHLTAIVCRFKVMGVGESGPDYTGDPYETTTLFPVTDTTEANKSFSKYTPAGQINLTITNPAAFGFFKQGEEYDILITPQTSGIGKSWTPPPAPSESDIGAGPEPEPEGDTPVQELIKGVEELDQ
jgi:hypothetical protein